MNRYERSPALLLGIGGFAAALATAGTLSVGVLLPVMFCTEDGAVVAKAAATRAPVEVAARYRIEVFGSRKANAA